MKKKKVKRKKEKKTYKMGTHTVTRERPVNRQPHLPARSRCAMSDAKTTMRWTVDGRHILLSAARCAPQGAQRTRTGEQSQLPVFPSRLHEDPNALSRPWRWQQRKKLTSPARQSIAKSIILLSLKNNKSS
jgi:hypothetical protein